MSKSNYPSKIDSTTELPIVRDNILQIGSEAINSIRSAIVQVEKTLGINPQGGVGETVASRLSKSLDELGNLLPEAIDRAGLISGPIVDEDVSSAAGIKESKLDLDFPTPILQSQISSLNHEVESIVNRITAIAATLSSHLALSSERHAASSISTAQILNSGAVTAVKSLLDTNAQDALDKIFSGHINFSGSISELNSSHAASQIWVDSTKLPFEAGSVQAAIENIYSAQEGDLSKHQELMHSSGIAKEYLVSGGRGVSILSSEPVSYSERSGDERGISQITFTSPVLASSYNILPGQEAVIENATDEDGLAAGSYTIYSIEKSADETQILSIYVYGTFGISSNSSSRLSVYKKKYVPGSLSSLLVAPRESASGTDSFILQVCNPNSSYVISSGIQPSFLNPSNRYMNIQINSESPVSFDFYSNEDSVQTIDSVVKRFNEQAEELHSSLLAYRYDSLDKSELVIAYNIPNSSSESYSITLTAGSDDGIEALGFSYLNGVEVTSDRETPYLISGIEFSGLPLKFSSQQISFLAGGSSVTLIDVSQSFIDSKVSVNDLLIISGAGSDSGTYRISAVTDGVLTLDSAQLPSGFSVSSSTTSNFRIYKNSIAVDQLQFSALSGVDSSYLLDLFLDSSGELRHQIAIAHESPLYLSSSVFSIVDCDGDVQNQEYSLQFSKVDGICVAEIVEGSSQRIFGSDFSFWLTHSSGAKLKIYIKDQAALSAKIDSAGGSFTASAYGVFGVRSKIDIMHLGKVSFESFRSRFGGSFDNARIEKKSSFGMISLKDIQEEVEKEFVHQPLSSIISNGVLSGLSISNALVNSDGLFTIDISQGEVFTSGKRLFVAGHQAFNTGISSSDSDKFFVAINEQGQICARVCNEDCLSPFDPYHFVLIGSVEWDDTAARSFDARLFISNSTFRYLTKIIVSPDISIGQFSSISTALKYIKRFSEFYPNLNAPDLFISNGDYEEFISVDVGSFTSLGWLTAYQSNRSLAMTPLIKAAIENGLYINYPIKISGSSSSTISIIYSLNFSDAPYNIRGYLMIGGKEATISGNTYPAMSNGFVHFDNIKFKNSKILLVDFLSNESFKHGVVLNDCLFDNDDYEENSVSLYLGEDSILCGEIFDTSSPKGCLTISGCKFIRSNIKFDQPSRVNNISIVNNQIYSDSEQGLVNGDIFSVSKDKNISMISNLNLGNITSTDGPIVFGEDYAWSDRIARNLRVCGDTSSTNFKYLNQKTIYKTILCEKLMGAAFGVDTGDVFMNALSVGSNLKRVIQFDAVTTAYAYIPLSIGEGEVFEFEGSAIFIYFTKVSSSTQSFQISIIKVDSFGQQTSTSVTNFGLSSSAPFGSFNMCFSSPQLDDGDSYAPIIGSKDYTYYLKLSRQGTPADAVYIHHIKYAVNILTAGDTYGGID